VGAYNRWIMGLVAGIKLGPYEILTPLGAGGMGEVYLARDTRLGREVAVKVLPSRLCSDPNQRERLEREARTISSLNHPNICQLHDVGCQDEIDFIVMEYVDGQTLAERLLSGPLPIKQALKIAIEIADALDKAHARGIIHRDLKSGNIMLTKSGVSKLMDFGLAKPTVSVSGKASGNGHSATPSAPTMSVAVLASPPHPLTEKGTIVGTFLYMAPELLRDEQADERSDIFSFGCVLYEMITGLRPFSGKSQLSLISAILEKDPESITNVQPSTSPAVEHIVLRCLAKDPNDRWQTFRDLGNELKWVAEASTVTRVVIPKPRKFARVGWALGAVLLGLIAWLGFARWKMSAAPERQPFRLSLLAPPSTSFVLYSLAISPDGRRIAFVAAAANGATNLWVRSLSSSAAQQIASTEGALYPFWSADSRQLGFFADRKLKKLDPSNGAIEIICDAMPSVGASWNSRGVILFTYNESGPIFKVDATGGVPQAVTKPGDKRADVWPLFLPDQDHFVYFSRDTAGPGEHQGVGGTYIGSLSSTERKLVSREIANNTQFALGRLYYVRDRSLMAQAFDVKKFQLTGTPEVIVPQELDPDPSFFRAGYSVSDNGAVVFQSATDNFSHLTWFDREGKELESMQGTGYMCPTLSRDGSLLVVSSDDARNGKHFIHLYDFARDTSTRITEGGSDNFPVLSPDGKTVAYSNAGADNIFTVAADSSSQPKELLAAHQPMANDWSIDGRYLLFMNFQSIGAVDLQTYDFVNHSVSPFTAGAEGQFSPDGKWVAFSGAGPRSAGANYFASELLVAKFPGPGGRVQISNHGGAQPRWRADGKELYYIAMDRKLMAVSIDVTNNTLKAGVPHALFQTRIIAPRIVLFQYAVSADGKRFLINSLPAGGTAPITVLVN
jgi:serine/threonine protein kinase/Tol biopolymer transport system component